LTQLDETPGRVSFSVLSSALTRPSDHPNPQAETSPSKMKDLGDLALAKGEVRDRVEREGGGIGRVSFPQGGGRLRRSVA